MNKLFLNSWKFYFILFSPFSSLHKEQASEQTKPKLNQTALNKLGYLDQGTKPL